MERQFDSAGSVDRRGRPVRSLPRAISANARGMRPVCVADPIAYFRFARHGNAARLIFSPVLTEIFATSPGPIANPALVDAVAAVAVASGVVPMAHAIAAAVE